MWKLFTNCPFIGLLSLLLLTQGQIINAQIQPPLPGEGIGSPVHAAAGAPLRRASREKCSDTASIGMYTNRTQGDKDVTFYVKNASKQCKITFFILGVAPFTLNPGEEDDTTVTVPGTDRVRDGGIIQGVCQKPTGECSKCELHWLIKDVD